MKGIYSTKRLLFRNMGAHNQEDFEEIPFLVSIGTMIGYAILTFIGHIRDFLRKVRSVNQITSTLLLKFRGRTVFIPL